ncbi:BING4CT-domain-containing protein [Annulohypoxylon maeteangense]|uniref:BING4CT-domain-containing protein n=1 Tax=Annulohypoxylon maeteangense TaxID=1927788 RepID=UPI0020089EC6|nr:BING4CT-domain-containing protein [Annulohypoxylon maeteangense]KAI0884681.1 BING4CT-domain-containing protein [Annulohypoxylon maeteangense]
MEVDTTPVDKSSKTKFDNDARVVKRTRTELVSKEEREKRRRLKEAQRDYGRGKKVNVKGIKDKKLRSNLKSLENKYQEATIKAKDAEILLENTSGFLEPEHELERTYRVRQDDIQDEVSAESAKKRFELKLDQFGPYVFEYSRTGRELLLGGRRGHVATMDWREGKLGCELQLRETVRDVQWLHNNQFFAVAQKKHVYIYDRQGVEVHCLRKHQEVTHMEFLPYHFLLATLGMSGFLKYQDVSTGQLVTEIPTKLGAPVSLAQNPYNAVLHTGHQNGTVTLWSPNSPEPLVKLLAHKGPVRSLAIDREGRYMVSAGQDCKMAVWDIRMFKEVNNYFTRQPASSIAISDRGLTAVGWGTKTTIWKGLYSKHAAEQEKVQSPYMAWGGEGKRIERVRWCPFEDILGLGHDEGFSSIIVPGAGEPNFDALEVNPFETAKQRQETEVKSLLNKLQPEMIALDPNFIGNLDLRSDKQRQAEKDLDAKPVDIETEIRNRARGKNSALRKYLRKQRAKNIIDDKRLKVEELWKEQLQQREQKQKEKEVELGPALARFAKRD